VPAQRPSISLSPLGYETSETPLICDVVHVSTVGPC
jgi:hypothetical protein